MSFKRFVFTGLLAISLLALTGCAAPVAEAPAQVVSTEDTGISIRDGADVLIELDAPAARIVSLTPSVTEILFTIDAGDQTVGRDDNVTYPEAALDVTSVGSMWGELPSEAILALEPDLVIAGEIVTTEQVEALRTLGLTVFWQANPTDFDTLYDNIMDLGVLTGNEDKAASVIADLQNRVLAVTDAVSGAEDKPDVFYQLDSTDPANPWTSGGGTFIDYVISMAGGTNIAADLDSYAQISTEDLITRDPDIVLMADALYGITAESVAARPGWDVITAVKNNALYPIDPYILSVPGPRLVDGLEETARLIHPELFE
jgi:iron complex transport system substrate-binding protein